MLSRIFSSEDALGSCGRTRRLLPHHLQHPLFHLFCRRFSLMGTNHPGITVRVYNRATAINSSQSSSQAIVVSHWSSSFARAGLGAGRSSNSSSRAGVGSPRVPARTLPVASGPLLATALSCVVLFHLRPPLVTGSSVACAPAPCGGDARAVVAGRDSPRSAPRSAEKGGEKLCLPVWPLSSARQVTIHVRCR